MNVYFTYESCGNLKSFTLFISVKAITKLNPKKKFKKLAAGVHVLQTELGHFTFLLEEDSKEMYNNYSACTAIVLLIKPFV